MLGDQPPESSRVPRRVRGRLEDHRVAGRERLPDLLDRDFERIVPGNDRPDHAGRLLHHRALAVDPECVTVRELSLPLEAVDELRRPEQAVGERGVELRPVREHDRSTHFGDELGAELFALTLDRRLQLFEAASSERTVGRPIGLVEGTARGRDRGAHVFDRRVGDLAQYLFGRGIDVDEALARLGLSQLTADEQPDLTIESARKLVRLSRGHCGLRSRG